MKILGISAFYHDSAAALVVGGEMVFGVQEERLNRIPPSPLTPLKLVSSKAAATPGTGSRLPLTTWTP